MAKEAASHGIRCTFPKHIQNVSSSLPPYNLSATSDLLLTVDNANQDL